jgi:hypothetical protein
MSYTIKDEDGYKIRVVARLEEAKLICAVREGWTYKFFRPPAQEPLFYRHNFEEALF